MPPMFTNGNTLKFVNGNVISSEWKNCGVQMYKHPIHGDVYLVFNPLYLEANPVPKIIK
jgi:hypothetical protein